MHRDRPEPQALDDARFWVLARLALDHLAHLMRQDRVTLRRRPLVQALDLNQLTLLTGNPLL